MCYVWHKCSANLLPAKVLSVFFALLKQKNGNARFGTNLIRIRTRIPRPFPCNFATDFNRIHYDKDEKIVWTDYRLRPVHSLPRRV